LLKGFKETWKEFPNFGYSTTVTSTAWWKLVIVERMKKKKFNF